MSTLQIPAELVAKRMNLQVMRITPEMAARWLDESNTHNRKISRSVVSRYAGDMSNGNWKLTNQGIAFGPNGVLLDGQHRLCAIVQSGVTVDMVVCFNVDAETQLVVDQGKTRSVADCLTLDGEMGHVTNEEVAVLNSMLRGLFTTVIANRKRTTHEVKQLMLEYRSPIQFSIKHLTRTRGSVRGVCAGTTRAVIARAWFSQDHDRLVEFCDVLKKGVARSDFDSGAILLWGYLVQSSNNGSGHQQLVERYAKTERALDAFIKKQPLTKLYASTQELFPLPCELEK